MALVEPEQCVGVAENHRRWGRLRNVSPFADHVHIHLPLATAGSTREINERWTTGDRRTRPSARSANRVPFRSMMTTSPRSAPSRISASRDLACELAYRFICTLYNCDPGSAA